MQFESYVLIVKKVIYYFVNAFLTLKLYMLHFYFIFVIMHNIFYNIKYRCIEYIYKRKYKYHYISYRNNKRMILLKIDMKIGDLNTCADSACIYIYIFIV